MATCRRLPRFLPMEYRALLAAVAIRRPRYEMSRSHIANCRETLAGPLTNLDIRRITGCANCTRNRKPRNDCELKHMGRERLASSKIKPTPLKSTRQAALTISRPELLDDRSDHQFRRLVHNRFGFLARHSSVLEGHAPLIGPVGIQYTILISLEHLSAEGNVSVKDIADHLHLSGAFTTVIPTSFSRKT